MFLMEYAFPGRSSTGRLIDILQINISWKTKDVAKVRKLVVPITSTKLTIPNQKNEPPMNMRKFSSETFHVDKFTVIAVLWKDAVFTGKFKEAVSQLLGL